MNIQFELNKLYYKYIDTSTINHYKLLLLTEEYRNIGKNYFFKYPNAREWKNLSKQAEMEYMDGSKQQAKIKKDFFENREIICKKDENKDCIICSHIFQEFYVEHNYHYEQCTKLVIKNITEDIMRDIQNKIKNK